MKHYDETFKKEAIRLAEEKGVRQAAQELHISYGAVFKWRQKAKAASQQSSVAQDTVGTGFDDPPVEKIETVVPGRTAGDPPADRSIRHSVREDRMSALHRQNEKLKAQNLLLMHVLLAFIELIEYSDIPCTADDRESETKGEMSRPVSAGNMHLVRFITNMLLGEAKELQLPSGVLSALEELGK